MDTALLPMLVQLYHRLYQYNLYIYIRKLSPQYIWATNNKTTFDNINGNHIEYHLHILAIKQRVSQNHHIRFTHP